MIADGAPDGGREHHFERAEFTPQIHAERRREHIPGACD